MPKEKLSMRKRVEILRMDAAGLARRQIARGCNVARSSPTNPQKCRGYEDQVAGIAGRQVVIETPWMVE